MVEIESDTEKKVLVFGGTGFVGESIVDELIRQNYTPVLLVRDESKLKQDWEDKIEIIVGDIETINLEDFSELNNVEASIYCIGLIREKGENTFQNFHVEYFKKALAISQEINSKKVILISANGAKEEGTEYQNTKWQAEQLIKNSIFEYVILRPSIITGQSSKYNFINVIKNLVKFKFVPIFGDGEYKIAPIARGEVATILVNSIWDSMSNGKTYVLCGDKEYTYKDFVNLVASKMNKKVIFVHIPLFIAQPLVAMLGRFNFFPITSDQLAMLIEGNTFEQKPINKDQQS